jgi:hypothetical protein
LLLSYVQQTVGIEPSALRITDLEVTVILAFRLFSHTSKSNGTIQLVPGISGWQQSVPSSGW